MQGSRSTRHVVLTGLLVAVIIVSALAGASPATVGAASAQIALSRYVVAPSGNVTVNGNTFHAGDTASVSLLFAGSTAGSQHRLGAATVRVDGNGTFAVTLTVPQGTNPGLYTVMATDTHGDVAYQSLDVPVEVQVKAGQAGSHVDPVPGLVVSVAGVGFQAGEKVSLAADFPLYTGTTSKFTKTVTADSGGAFGAIVLQVSWDAKDGNVPLTITGATSGKASSVTVTLRISHKPFIILDSSTVSPAQSIVAQTGGFIPSERIVVATIVDRTDASKLRLQKVVNVGGHGMTRVGLFLPRDTQAGNYLLTVIGTTAHFHAAARYTVTASKSSPTPAAKATSTPSPKSTVTPVPSHAAIDVAPQSVIPGAKARVRGTGFPARTQVIITSSIGRTNAPAQTVQVTTRTNGRGTFIATLHTPGDAAAGGYSVTATGGGKSAGGTLHIAYLKKATSTPAPKSTVTPVPSHAAIDVAPRSVIPGATAQVLGTGFPANTQVIITSSIGRSNASALTVRATATANSKGAFVATLHTPGDAAAGGYSVTATGGGRSATGTLHIAYLKTALVSLPARAIPGTPISVTGFGFASGSTVTVNLNGQKLGTATANASGTFKAQFTIPGSLAAGMYALTAQDSAGRRASFSLQIYRQIATHFYFASLFTGPGFQESLLFTNTSAIRAVVHITYQRQSGPPLQKTISVPAHSRLTHDVNADLGGNVTAAASIATDVPISAERLVMHGRDGSIDPGAPSPARSWYFANGNTSHQYQEQIAVQNPTDAFAQVTLQVQPTHSKTYELHGTMHPQSRMSWDLNRTSHDAIGVIVTADHPVVANRTIFIHNGITSKTGVKNPRTQWFFAAGPTRGNTRHWIGVINGTGQASYMVLQAYDAQGAQVLTVKKWLRPYDRQGFLMNKLAGQTDVAVTITTTRPSIAEQSTFVSGNHDADTDTFGVTAPEKSAEFAAATTWLHQDNLLALFNPNAVAIPVVVQFLNAHGGTSQQTSIVAPFAHVVVDVGRVVPNSQLGLLAVSSYPFVALDRQEVNDGAGAMTTLGTQN